MRITRPRDDEPIRLVKTRTGYRCRAVIATGQHPDGRRRQETRTFDTLREARDWVSETKLSVKRGTYTAPDRATVDAICTTWLDSKRDVRAVTLNTYATVLKAVRARLGARRVQDVRRSDVEEFVSWLSTDGGRAGQGVSHRTVVLTLGTLRMVFAYAVAEGLIPASPVETVKPPRKRPQDGRKITVWSTDELARFIGHADTDDWAAAWRLTASGLRRSEVLGMTWDDLDPEAGTVTVRQGRVGFGSKSEAIDAPKSKASARTVPIEAMHAGSMALFRSLSAAQAAARLKAGEAWFESGFVVVDALGHPVRPEMYSDRFRTICREADVPVIRLHDVRHSVATLLHAAGTAPAHAAALLGHGLPVHMATYVTAAQDGVDAAGAALSRVLAEAK
jgi:integrase